MIRFLALGLMCATPIYGQRSPPPPPTRNIVTRTNQKEMDALLNRTPIRSVEDQSVRLARQKQINDDFRGLQLANNKMMSTVAGQAQIDVKFVSKMLNQISARAKRLQKNMSLPEVEAATAATSTSSDLNQDLIALDHVIVRFANNEMFKKMGVVDVELASEASRDLNEIVRLIERLKKVKD